MRLHGLGSQLIKRLTESRTSTSLFIHQLMSTWESYHMSHLVTMQSFKFSMYHFLLSTQKMSVLKTKKLINCSTDTVLQNVLKSQSNIYQVHQECLSSQLHLASATKSSSSSIFPNTSHAYNHQDHQFQQFLCYTCLQPQPSACHLQGSQCNTEPRPQMTSIEIRSYAQASDLSSKLKKLMPFSQAHQDCNRYNQIDRV